VVLPVRGRDLVAAFADDDGEFGFVVRLGGDGGQDDLGAVADDGGVELQENGRDGLDLLLGFSSVRPVVEPDGEEAGRIADGSNQGDFLEREELRAGGERPGGGGEGGLAGGDEGAGVGEAERIEVEDRRAGGDSGVNCASGSDKREELHAVLRVVLVVRQMTPWGKA
jgi:hypothetical protein